MAAFLRTLSLIAIFIVPLVYMNAMRGVRDHKPTGIHELVLGVCGVIILWSIFNTFMWWL